MSNYCLKKFSPMDVRVCDTNRLIEVTGLTQESIYHSFSVLSEQGNIKTIWHLDEILGFISWNCINRHVFEFWLVPYAITAGTEVGLGVARLLYKELELLLAELPWRRIQAMCLPEHSKWVEFFGFEKEGEMKYFGESGQSLIMYGRYRV